MSRTKAAARKNGLPKGKRRFEPEHEGDQPEANPKGTSKQSPDHQVNAAASLPSSGDRPAKKARHTSSQNSLPQRRLRRVNAAASMSTSGEPAVFISGAASGIGKGFVTAYAKLIQSGPPAPLTKASRIYVLDMNGKLSSTELYKLYNLGSDDQDWIDSHIIPLECNIKDTPTLERLISTIPDDIALVIHSAGVRGLVPHAPIEQYSDVAKAEDLDIMNAKTMQQTFEINTMGTFFALRALLPHLKSQINGSDSDASPPKVVVMGSRMGSIGHNTLQGGAYAYRASKAALNAVVKSLSVDVPEVIWTVVHPGRIESGLVPIKEDDAMPVDEAVKELLPLIDELGRDDSGHFIDRFGQDIVW